MARIINKLDRDDERSYPSVLEAHAKLEEMVTSFRSRGLLVLDIEDEHNVSDEHGQEVGIYYVSE